MRVDALENIGLQHTALDTILAIWCHVRITARTSHIPIATAAAVAAIATPLATPDDELAVAPFSTAVTVGSPHPTHSMITYNITLVIPLFLHPALLLLFRREQVPASPMWCIAPRTPRTTENCVKSQDAVVQIWIVVADWRRFFRRCSR